MSSVSTEAKVGLFVLIALVILGYMSFQVGEYGFGLRKGYIVTAVFDNVTGLDKDASVKIAGVEVGRVEEISLQDGKALVSMRINPNVKIEDDATISIKTHGILGDKYVDIVPGADGDVYITEGQRIHNVETQADIDKLLREMGLIAEDIRVITASLRNVMGGEKGQASLADIIENTRQLTESLNRVVVSNEERMGGLIETLARTSVHMEQTFASLADITGKVKEGEGTIGKLVNDEETVVNLNASLKSIDKSMEGINNYVSKADQFRTYLSYRGEFFFDSGDAKSYLDLTLQPKEDKFYILGLVADPRGKRTIRDTTTGGTTTRTEEWDRDGILFNVQIGKRFKNIALRGGLFESTGGVGIDYFAFDDDLRLSFEAFDFDTDRDGHLKVYGEYKLFNHVYLTAGWDDFISDEGNESAFAGIAIRFEDEDLKYLLTSVPLPSN